MRLVGASSLGDPFRLLLAFPFRNQLLNQCRLCHIELVGGALQEQHPEDVVLVLRRVHLAAQDICGGVQMPLQLRQRELCHSRFSSYCTSHKTCVP